ncbi:MAG: MerR family transcriptional regulator [Rhodobacteraceae bacterium]|nr:MerR family transcriptional regulator [Paracoccaceae bacterium]
MQKSPDAFRTISEVADDLDLPQHVLRFWETRFSHIKPLKRGGGRRYYRPDDVELLRGIRHLLYDEGYTIKGVQRILKEQGPRFVMQVWHVDGVKLSAAPNSQHPIHVQANHEPLPTASESADEEIITQPRDLLPDNASQEAHEKSHAGMRFMGRLRGGEKSDASHAGGQTALSREDVQSLQSTLFELLECKRILDQAK